MTKALFLHPSLCSNASLLLLLPVCTSLPTTSTHPKDWLALDPSPHTHTHRHTPRHFWRFLVCLCARWRPHWLPVTVASPPGWRRGSAEGVFLRVSLLELEGDNIQRRKRRFLFHLQTPQALGWSRRSCEEPSAHRHPSAGGDVWRRPARKSAHHLLYWRWEKLWKSEDVIELFFLQIPLTCFLSDPLLRTFTRFILNSRRKARKSCALL